MKSERKLKSLRNEENHSVYSEITLEITIFTG